MRKIIFLLLFILLIYTRFVNLGWGLPYPMHPDERNMAVALQQLTCNIQFSTHYSLLTTSCFNPHFFAYGQLPLYLGYFLIQIHHLLTGTFGQLISFGEATLALRFISAVSSIITVFFGLKIVQLIINKNPKFEILNSKQIQNPNIKIQNIFTIILFIFSPGLIQFAHFGTTESLLMLFYSIIIYLSLRLLYDRTIVVNVFLLSLFSGFAIATKISSVIFIVIPLIAILLNKNFEEFADKLFTFVRFISSTIIFAILFSPYNIISFKDFLGSISYESSVATGRYIAFYTRQFVDSWPVFFQITKIFPYALGVPVLILFILGFIFLPRNKEMNLMRIAFLVYFLPNAFLFAKWTRFMAPVIPLMLIIAILFLIRFCHPCVYRDPIKNGRIVNWIPTFVVMTMLILFLLPGLAYLSVYQNQDVRFTASNWIYKNIPSGSVILSETANVVDIPIINKLYGQDSVLSLPSYNYISFNFYDLDENKDLQEQLKEYLQKADYVFVPSRRIFANYKEKYPLLSDYYQKLFSGQLGFEKVAEFTSYPKNSLFGKTILEFPDEQAEETWTVFDHPVVRIYKRI